MATDTRLWLYGQLHLMRAALRELIAAAADRAEAEVDVLMPGYTHLQPAMVRWAGSWGLAAGCQAAGAVGYQQPAQTLRGGHWPAPCAAARTVSGHDCPLRRACMPACLQRGPAHCIRRLLCRLVPPPLQTVRWGHWLLSHAAAWQRDDMRLGDLMPRVGTLPLGSGGAAAAAGKQSCTCRRLKQQRSACGGPNATTSI